MTTEKIYVIDFDGRAATSTVDEKTATIRGKTEVSITEKEKQDIERRDRMAMDLVAALISQKKTDSAYGDTTITLSWREGGLNKIDISDHVSYK